MRSGVLKSDGVREVALGDLHVPDHDPHAWELALRAVEVIQPERVILLGDMLDCASVSRYRQPPKVIADGLQPQIDLFGSCMRDLHSAAPDAQIVMLPGNHELRIEAWLMDHPGLWGLDALRLPNLLRLDRLGVVWEPQEVPILRTLIAKHGSRVRRASGASALAELADEFYSVSVLHGHTHRLGAAYASTRSGLVAGYECGCLCNLTPAYLHNRPNWQHGLAVITHWRKDAFHVDLIPFLGSGANRKAVVWGQAVRTEG
jgi:hypothetical protein